MNNSSGKTGFTLVELLMAVAIIVTILSIVCGSYFAISKSTKSCKAKIALSQQARKVLNQIARQIRCSYAATTEMPVNTAKATSHKRRSIPENIINYFHGNPDAPTGEILHLVTTNGIFLGQKPADGLFDVTYRFEKNKGLLLRSQQRFVGTSKGLVERRNWQPIIRNVEYIELAFFDGQQWLREWDFKENRELPCAAKITIKCEDENHQQYRCSTIAYVCCRNNKDQKTPVEAFVLANE